MRNLRLRAIAFCGIFLLCLRGTPVFADTSQESPTTAIEEQGSSETMSKESQVEDGSLGAEADDWLSKNLNKDYSALGVDASLFQLASKPDSLTSVNQSYASVMEEFTEKGYGNAEPLTEAVLSDYRQSAQKLFTDSFGDLSKSLSLKTPNIPKSMNSSSYLKKASKARDQAYKKQKKSSIYKRVKKEVDSSKSIKKVKNKL